LSLIKKIYNEAVIKGNGITIDGKYFSAVKGKHSIWVPGPEMKIPWSYNGKITSFKDWEKGKDAKEIEDRTFNSENRYWDRESLQSIMNEYTIFKKMDDLQLAPPIKGMFYIKNITSDFIPDVLTNDTKGVYGYYMRDAYKMEQQGKYNFNDNDLADNYGYYRVDYLPDRFENHIEPLLIISAGAKGDMRKEDNIIKGYLIDIRRSIFDMMTLKDLPEDAYKEIEYRENDIDGLKKKIKKLKGVFTNG
jgi:hypothetical protein